MKRSLMAMLLVVTLIMSCFCSVSAATMEKDEFLEKCATLETEIDVPVDIAGAKVAGSYGDLIVAEIGNKASFKAEINMKNVIDVVTSVLSFAETALGAGSTALAEFQDLDVTGEFTFTATWTDVEAPVIDKDVIVDGFDGLGDIFEVDSVTPGADSVTIIVKVKAGTKVTKLAELPEKITLVVDGFTVIGDDNNSNSEDGMMEGEISGWTKIANRLTTSYDVNYNFVQPVEGGTFVPEIKPVIIDVDEDDDKPSNGSTSITKFYTLKYETNGGNTYADESHKEGKTVELTKVPEKDGYAFSGWYSDAELTNKITSVVMDSDKIVYAAWTATGEPGGETAHPVPDVLNGEDHIAYIHGYPDGTVRPEANITRAEVAAIFFRLLKDEVRNANLTSENNFVDVNDGDWYNKPVSTMAKLGIVSGRTPDTFAPDDYITRAEFATICARFDDADELCEECNFTDIAGHWAEDYILEAVEYKWIQGYENNTFRPDNNITRAEAATLINRVLVRVPEDATCLLDGMKLWPDNNTSAWYYIAIQEATNSHTYGRIDAVNEKWNELTENRDWLVYED